MSTCVHEYAGLYWCCGSAHAASILTCKLSQLFAQTRFYIGKFLMKELDFYLNLSPSPDVGPEMQVGLAILMSRTSIHARQLRKKNGTKAFMWLCHQWFPPLRFLGPYLTHLVCLFTG
jgi:hypothetical protein